eukprot:2002909-Ditylum_brightwellii.AAC.1
MKQNEKKENTEEMITCCKSSKASMQENTVHLCTKIGSTTEQIQTGTVQKMEEIKIQAAKKLVQQQDE